MTQTDLRSQRGWYANRYWYNPVTVLRELRRWRIWLMRQRDCTDSGAACMRLPQLCGVRRMDFLELLESGLKGADL